MNQNDTFRKTLRTLLKQGTGFNVVVEAKGATEAVARARHFAPQLAILDSSLPEMKEFQLAQELRKILPRLVIFLLTADRDLRVEKEALSCGIDAVFSQIDDLEALAANAADICEKLQPGGPR